MAFAVACSGGGDSDDDSDATNTPQPSGDATSTPSGGGDADTATAVSPDPTETPEVDPTSSDPGGGGISPQVAARFGELVRGIENAEYVVSYNVTADAVDTDPFEGALTLYQSPDRTRVDFEAETGGETVEGSTIDTPDKSYVCIDADGEQTCLELSRGTQSPFPIPGDEITETVSDFEDDADQYSVTVADSRVLAGTSAECFDIDGPDGIGTMCFSADGVMLLMELDGPEGSYRMEATEYRTGVSDADFEPPYPIVQFGI